MSRRRKLLAFVFLLALAAAALSFPARRYLAAVNLLEAMASESRSVAPLKGPIFEGITLPDGTPVEARTYGPEDASETIVLIHGIHHRGVDEPRLVRFARHLANQGCRVVTPELRELADYQVTKSGVTTVQATVATMSQRSPVGLIGFSFGGGLSLLAATSTETADRLRYVASVGGYHDLHRSLRYLATHEVESPSGTEPRRAHEYGLLVLLYGHLDHFALGDDLPAFRAALKSWLMEDRAVARRKAAAFTTTLARDLFQMIEKQQLNRISGQLLELLRVRTNVLRALSPAGRLRDVKTEVLLLHGAFDTVVPPEETLFAAQELERADHPQYRTLVTPLLEHVRVDHPGDLMEKLALVGLVSRFF